MNLKAVVCLLALFFLAGGAARAQDVPKLDVFVGYSYLNLNPTTAGVDNVNLHGGSASAAYNFGRWFGLVGDFGGYQASNIQNSGLDAHIETYLFGPRFSYRNNSRFTPYAQVLLGGAHVGGDFDGAHPSDNGFAMALGGGLDVRLSHRFSVRPVQVEYLQTRFNEISGPSVVQDNLRLSTGLVIHF